MESLIGKTALVTGASRGIGRATALELARRGARIAIAARGTPALEETATLIRCLGASVLTLTVDVAEATAIETMVKTTKDTLGDIDVLVNNAGIHQAIGPFWQIDANTWWREIEVNLKGTFLCTHAVLSTMIRRRAGRIINLGSSASVQIRPYSSAYATSKTAIMRLTECLAMSTRDYGVALFTVNPGAICTDMAKDLMSEPATRWVPEYKAIYDNSLSADLPARLIADLAAGRADALSGQFISVHDDLDARLAKAAKTTI